jgi:hypothetical protein
VGGRIGEVVNTIEAAKEAAENRKELACRALDASFDQFAKSLADAGFELVPFEDKLKQPEFSLFTGSPPPDWCQATRAPARMNYLNPFKWKDTFRVVQQLIDALGVDAIVMGQLSANGVQNGVSSLFAYVKGADGVASVGWSGKVSKGKFQFDSAGKDESDQTKLANAARVFAHTFELLATKMGAETK